MTREVIGRVVLGVWLGCVTSAAAQLPPDVLVDKHLLQAKMLSEEKDHKGALEVMDRVVALQKEHGLTLPEAFSFQYAQTALAAGSVQAAIKSASRYLTAAGREGKYYQEALELLVKAERSLQEPVAGQAETGPAETEVEPQARAVPPATPEAQERTAVRPVVNCRKWNTKKFFRKATVEEVAACLDSGTDPMARNKEKKTPLHYAALYNENPAVIEILLKAGAEVDARNKWKGTPLHWAAWNNENPEVVEALLKAGADPNARANDLETPLHRAARNNENPEVVEALLKAGADQTAADEKDRTPLQVARRQNRKVLRDAWAKLSERQKAAHKARVRREKASAGPSLLDVAVGLAGGAAITAAGGGTEAAADAGTVFAESVITGQSPAGSSAPGVSGSADGPGATAGGGGCQVPGYPDPPGGVANLGFSWCPASVGLQVRSYALQAAGAECAIATGSSSTPEQIEARRREIRAACDRLRALGQGNCQCPPGLGQ